MARITFRLDDETHDRLIRRALRSNINLSELIRPALSRVADPSITYVPTVLDAQIILSARVLSLLLLDMETRRPELREKGAVMAATMLRKWGMPEEVCDLALRDGESGHAR